MIVSHFNSYLLGGAATAAKQLHLGLLANQIESRFQFRSGEADGLDSDQENGSNQFFTTQWASRPALQKAQDAIRFRLHRQRFKFRSAQLGEGLEIFTSPHGQPFTPWPPVAHPAASATSALQHVIHLHWISKFIDFPSFFGSLPKRQPVVWTLHDMNALTGGCHFSGGCERYRLGCGNCPQLRWSGQNDASAEAFRIKRQALKDINLHVVAPSRWLLSTAKSSPLLSDATSFTRIPYGMPVDRLYPENVVAARQRLGIDPRSFVFCFGAMNLASRRKGASALIKALKSMRDRDDVLCLVFGSGSLSDHAGDLPAVQEVGNISDDAMRRDVYSAADAFVLPSTEDNLPLTGLEAMACGTSVIGFDAGGIPDYVRPNQTGLLAPSGDAHRLGMLMQWAVDHRDQVELMGRRARRLIVEQFETSVEAKAYTDLYRNVLFAEGQDARKAA